MGGYNFRFFYDTTMVAGCKTQEEAAARLVELTGADTAQPAWGDDLDKLPGYGFGSATNAFWSEEGEYGPSGRMHQACDGRVFVDGC